MTDKTPEDVNPNASEQAAASSPDAEAASSEEADRSVLPVALAGIGILAVVVLLIAWPSSDDRAVDSRSGAAAKSVAADVQGRAGPRGGVQPRAVDDPSRRAGGARFDPAPRPAELPMAPEPPPEVIPEFANRAEEIAWYEHKLTTAKQMRDSRQVFADRLPSIRARIEKSDNPSEGLAAFEGRKKIVEDNLSKAQAKVDELQRKLVQLRGT